MTMARYLYSELAAAVQSILNCRKANNTEWLLKWEAEVKRLQDNYLPSGSGFDNGCEVDLDASHAEKLVIRTSYHHMHESGVYDGWTDHTVTVTPSLSNGFRLRISGRNRNDIKEYIGQTFEACLHTDLLPDILRERHGLTWRPLWDEHGCRIIGFELLDATGTAIPHTITEAGNLTVFTSHEEMDAYVVQNYDYWPTERKEVRS